jgi:hypothetical protein
MGGGMAGHRRARDATPRALVGQPGEAGDRRTPLGWQEFLILFFCERVLNPHCYYLRPFWDKTYEFVLNPLVNIIELFGPGDECTQYLRMQQPNTPGHTDLLRPFQII